MNYAVNERRRGFFRRIGPTLEKLFKHETPSEGYGEQRAEEVWEREYKHPEGDNYTEILSTRLTNYALFGSSIEADDEEVQKAIKRLWKKARKVSTWALAVGRSYLVPYVVGGEIYTDIVPQSRAIVTRRRGDEVHGFASLSDLRSYGKKLYARWTLYEYDDVKKTFTIENKATQYENGSTVPLGSIPEWADIQPYLQFGGVVAPLFAFVDCPRDNRDTDMMQGASIAFGAERTIAEIEKNNHEFFEEFDKKSAKLGYDRTMIEKGQVLDRYAIPFMNGGKGTGNGSLFEVFDPAMRDGSYISRSDALYRRLEKQVGTSSGIFTNAEVSLATATQVRRAMFDTIALVDALRQSFEDAIDALKYAYAVYANILGRAANAECTVTLTWSNRYIDDDMERFNKISQGHSAGVVSDVEYRREIFPNETIEEAEKALKEIEEGKEDPIEYLSGQDFGDSGAGFDNESQAPVEDTNTEE